MRLSCVPLGLLALVVLLPSSSSADFIAERVLSGLNRPTFVTAPPGDPDRLFILEWEGQVRIARHGVLEERPFLDVRDIVFWDEWERGLLGMAFDPDYENNGWFYLYFINHATPNGSSVIRRFTVSADPDSADRSTLHRVFTLPQVGADHNGGHIEFGPDGYLWLGLGDGGVAPGNDRAQDPSDLFGTMIRIDPHADDFPADAANNYAVPAGNPFVGTAGVREEIVAYGLRNPYRFAFDEVHGDLYIGDVGQGAWEEIDRVPYGMHGQNFGWRIMEGEHCYQVEDCDTRGLTMPIHEYDHPTGFAVTGGRVYHGSAIPSAKGLYFFGDYITDRLWTMRIDGGVAGEVVERTVQVTPRDGSTIDSIVCIGKDGMGELYIVDLGGPLLNGEIFRLVRDPEAVGAPEPVPASRVALSPPAPNPFSRTSSLTLSLSGRTPLHVGVYTAAGRRIRTLLDDTVDGTLRVSWDGRGRDGTPVPSGVYFIRARTPDLARSQAVTLIR